MKAFHALCGLPRSGSTMIQNLLNQNPEFHCSSTSALASMIGGLIRHWSQSPAIKSDLADRREKMEMILRTTIEEVVNAWYVDHSEVVFDKSRDWIALLDAVNFVWPEMRLLCCIRDPREVFSSIERQHKRFPLLSDGDLGEPILAKANRLFSPDGMIGGPMTHVENALRRKSQHVVPVVYEKFVEDPDRELRKLYAELKMDWWDGHDFEHVDPTATDLDALYLNKFPHDGSGSVEVRPITWMEHVPGDIARLVIDRYPGFCKAFGYA